MGEEGLGGVVPWLLERMRSESSAVERSGAAQVDGCSKRGAAGRRQRCSRQGAAQWAGGERDPPARPLHCTAHAQALAATLCAVPFLLVLPQGLAEVLAVQGPGQVSRLLPDILLGCRARNAAVREGHLTLFKYLPRCMPEAFVEHLPKVRRLSGLRFFFLREG